LNKVYLNGRFVERDQACLPITDRGLLFGDSVYEVIPAFGGAPFRAEQHLARLDRSLRSIRMRNPHSIQEWFGILDQLCSEFPSQDHSIYLQVTRGSYPTRAHKIPDKVEPTVIAFATPMAERAPGIASEGIKVITLEDIRWQRCDVKATTLLPNVLAQAEAAEKGAIDAILVRQGQALEGTASNLFIVLEGLLITPADSEKILPGVTRDLVLELARDANIPYAQASISEEDLKKATEIWLTSSTREIAPVVELDGEPVGDGKPGEHWRYIDQLYQAAKQRLRLQAQANRNHR
jgi:D-alanine transaminase